MRLNQKMYRFILLSTIVLSFAGCLPTSYKDLEKGDLVIETNRKPGSVVSTSEDYITSEQRLGDRYYIESVFREVFGPSYDTSSFVRNNIVVRQSVFGGPCDVYEASKKGENTTAMEFPNFGCFDANWNTDVIVGSTSLREGWRIRACEQIVSSNSTAVTYALNKAGVSTSSGVQVTYEAVNSMFKLFYPIEELTDTAYQEIKAYDVSMGRTDFWKSVLVIFCITPEWQVP